MCVTKLCSAQCVVQFVDHPDTLCTTTCACNQIMGVFDHLLQGRVPIAALMTTVCHFSCHCSIKHNGTIGISVYINYNEKMNHQLMTFLISLAHSHFKNVSQYFCTASTYSASVSFLTCGLSVIVNERWYNLC